MVRPAATSPFALVLVSSAVLSAACFDTSSTVATAYYPTLLTVEPLMFRGSLGCGAPGLARYVVTLTDVSVAADGGDGTHVSAPLKSSIPVACQTHVSFGDALCGAAPSCDRGVISTHFYIATIDGYDRDDVEPADPGSPQMRDPSSKELIAPTWTTTCGEVPPPDPPADAEADAAYDGPSYNQLRYPTQVLGTTEVILHGCIPLAPAPTSDASVDDGSGGADSGSADGETPRDASFEGSDVVAPDGGGPGDEEGGGGEEEGGG